MGGTVTTKNSAVMAEYNTPEFASYLFAMRDDQHRRLVRRRAPDAVVTAAPLPSGSTEYALRPLKGSVMLFWSQPGHGLIPAIREAYANGDEAALQQLSVDVAREIEIRPVLPLDEAFEKVFACPMYFDLLYGKTQLVTTLALPGDIPYGAFGFAYNGGMLADDAFELVEYFTEETASYDTLIVKVPPDLSDVERQALEAVPEDMTDLNIGYSVMCPLACVGIAAIVVALITCAGNPHAELEARMAQVTLSQEQLDRIGPLASARQLLAVRREIFEQFGS